MTQKIQKFGKFLSSMVMPNIGAFIAWGFITAFFIATGWFPNEELASLVDPMLSYLLPVLIAYTGGKVVAGDRGSVIASIGVLGVIVGADIPMLIGAMIMGPLAGLVIKSFDKAIDGKVKTGFEMLVNNFSIGILGMILAIIGYYAIGPLITSLTGLIESGVQVIVDHNALPLAAIFIEPAKVLFLNNAINHGIFTPIGINEVDSLGQSIMFLLESNPGPGLGILLAYCIFGKGSSKESAPGAVIIHFFGGIHEIYFPYILMNPLLIIAAIVSNAAGIFVFSMMGAGLSAAASPGSILAILALAPKGGHVAILLGVLASTVVSFFVAAPFIKKASEKEGGDDLEKAQQQLKENKSNITKSKDDNKEASGSKITPYSNIKHIVFACDAGMGSSAMGASKFKKRIENLETDIKVTNSSVDSIESSVQIVVTHNNLVERVSSKNLGVEIVSINNFLKDENLDMLFERIETKDEGGSASDSLDSSSDNKTDDKDIKHIVFACDAGMGSSAMGASKFKKRIENLETGIKVTNSSVDNIAPEIQIVVTHQNLVERVSSKNLGVEIVSISNFLKDENLDKLFERFESIYKK